MYDLFAVVLHSGSPHSGHYHAYIRDMLGEGNWRVLGGDMTAQSELTSASQAVAAAAGAGCVSRAVCADVCMCVCTCLVPGCRKPGGPTVTHPDSPLPVLVKLMEGAPVHPTWKLKYMQLDALGTALSGEIHSSWKNVYRKDWGGMKEFLVGQPEYFEIRSQAVVLKASVDTEWCIPVCSSSYRLACDQTKYPPIEVAEAPVSVPVPPDDDEASVALARQLQAEEDTKKGAARSGAGSAGDEWTVVGTSAKKPVLTEAPAVGKPVVTGATTVLTELAQHWGHWFDFNDSVVTPMSVPALGKAFAGKISVSIV